MKVTQLGEDCPVMGHHADLLVKVAVLSIGGLSPGRSIFRCGGKLCHKHKLLHRTFVFCKNFGLNSNTKGV